MIKVACLGWGSLCWQPGELPIQGEWKTDGPELPIEFARQSKGGRLTLVVVPGVSNVRTLWARMDLPSVSAAIDALASREGCNRSRIGFCSLQDISYARIGWPIHDWMEKQNLEAVVWTMLPPKFHRKNGVVPSVEEAVEYLRMRRGQELLDAREYVERAPAQIRTPYRTRFEKELGWLPA